MKLTPRPADCGRFAAPGSRRSSTRITQFIRRIDGTRHLSLNKLALSRRESAPEIDRVGLLFWKHVQICKNEDKTEAAKATKRSRLNSKVKNI